MEMFRDEFNTIGCQSIVEFGTGPADVCPLEKWHWRSISKGEDGEVYYSTGQGHRFDRQIVLGNNLPDEDGPQIYVRVINGRRKGKIIEHRQARGHEKTCWVGLSVPVDDFRQVRITSGAREGQLMDYAYTEPGERWVYEHSVRRNAEELLSLARDRVRFQAGIQSRYMLQESREDWGDLPELEQDRLIAEGAEDPQMQSDALKRISKPQMTLPSFLVAWRRTSLIVRREEKHHLAQRADVIQVADKDEALALAQKLMGNFHLDDPNALLGYAAEAQKATSLVGEPAIDSRWVYNLEGGHLYVAPTYGEDECVQLLDGSPVARENAVSANLAPAASVA